MSFAVTESFFLNYVIRHIFYRILDLRDPESNFQGPIPRSKFSSPSVIEMRCFLVSSLRSELSKYRGEQEALTQAQLCPHHEGPRPGQLSALSAFVLYLDKTAPGSSSVCPSPSAHPARLQDSVSTEPDRNRRESRNECFVTGSRRGWDGKQPCHPPKPWPSHPP